MADYTDDFERADGTDLGANYTPCIGTGLNISSGTVVHPVGGDTRSEIINTAVNNDQYIEATVGFQGTGPGAYPVIYLGISGADSTLDGYAFSIGCQNGDWYLTRYTDGADSTLTSGTQAVTSPFTMRIERSGDGFTAKINGSTVGTTTDSTYSDGNLGIGIYRESYNVWFTQIAYGDAGGSVGGLLKQLLMQQ